MKLISFKEYLEYLRKNREITIEDVRIELEPIRVKRLTPLPEELTDISTTVWSFPKRGSWATHRGDYRGNWPPQMARALIQMYTRPGDTVLDPMIGSGTTCIEAKLLGRNCIGVDINYNAVILTLHRLYWLEKALLEYRDRGLDNVDGVSLDDIMKASTKIYLGDARSLEEIEELAQRWKEALEEVPPGEGKAAYSGLFVVFAGEEEERRFWRAVVKFVCGKEASGDALMGRAGERLYLLCDKMRAGNARVSLWGVGNVWEEEDPLSCAGQLNGFLLSVRDDQAELQDLSPIPDEVVRAVYQLSLIHI